MSGQGVVADEADHFLDQVFLEAQIEAPARRHDFDHAIACGPRKAETRHDGLAFGLGDGHADDLGGPHQILRRGIPVQQRQFTLEVGGVARMR